MTHPATIPNKAPAIMTDLTDVSILQGETLDLTIATHDPEGDHVTLAVVSDLPAGASFDGSTLRFTPDASQVGYQSTAFSLLATDSNQNTFSETFAVSVIPTTLVNGDFESGDASTNTINNWTVTSWQDPDVDWEPVGTGMNGTRSVSITNATENDTRVVQTVSGLTVGATYRLSGWVRGESIVNPTGNIGAVLGIEGTYTHSGPGLTGTFGWTHVELPFDATDTSMTFGCRLGHWGNTVTGKAWFDDVVLDRL